MAETKMTKLAGVNHALQECVHFLTAYLPLANCHAADFITGNVWELFLPENIRQELSNLTEEDLLELPFKALNLSQSNSLKNKAKNLEQRCVPSTDFRSKSTTDCCKVGSRQNNHASPNDRSSYHKQDKRTECATEAETAIGDAETAVGGACLKTSDRSHGEGQSPVEQQSSPGWINHTDLASFIHHCSSHRLDGELGSLVLTSLEDLTNDLGLDEIEQSSIQYKFMSEKKSHEVNILAGICVALTNIHHTDVVVDVGSGKGYLGTHLALQHGLHVLGVDSSCVNTRGAVSRARKLGRQWKGLTKEVSKKKTDSFNENTRGSTFPAKSGCSVFTGNQVDGHHTLTEDLSNIAPENVSDNSTDCLVQSVCDVAYHDSDPCDPKTLTVDDDYIETLTNFTFDTKNLINPTSDNQNIVHPTNDTIHNVDLNFDTTHVMNDVNPTSDTKCVSDPTSDIKNVVDPISDIKYVMGLPFDKQNHENKILNGAAFEMEYIHNFSPAKKLESNTKYATNAYSSLGTAFGSPGIIASRKQYHLFSNKSEVDEIKASQLLSVNYSQCNHKKEPFKLKIQKTTNFASNLNEIPMCRNYVPLTQFVHPSTDFLKLLKDYCPKDWLIQDSESEVPPPFLLTGLHTCGDLAASVLHIFTNSEDFGALSTVGCCYNMLTEKFEMKQESSCPLGDQRDLDSRNSGFPLSSYLRDMEFKLGKAARNVACQSLYRIAADRKLQGKTFFRRALLQKILYDMGHTGNDRISLQKLEQKAASHYDYMYRAFVRLELHTDKLTPALVDEYVMKYQDVELRMAAFFQVRALLAPCIEALILLDRLTYLLEQDCVQTADLVQLFDPTTSPRCYGLIAMKQQNGTSDGGSSDVMTELVQ